MGPISTNKEAYICMPGFIKFEGLALIVRERLVLR